jgi:triosephosphate isomerase
MNGDDLTQLILADTGYTVLMISKKLEEAGEKHLSDGFEFGRSCMAGGIGFYVLTASGTDDVKKHDNGLAFCSADETTLKTIVRANPGYLLLKDGTILGKWSWANLPDMEWFGKTVNENK